MSNITDSFFKVSHPSQVKQKYCLECESFGDIMRALRDKVGLGLEYASARLGVWSKSKLHRIECNKERISNISYFDLDVCFQEYDCNGAEKARVIIAWQCGLWRELGWPV